MSNIVGNRHSTPEATNSLRPPTQRATASGHLLRASADMSNIGASSPLSGRSIRPASEVYPGQQGQNGQGDDAADTAAQNWISEIDQFETTLEEMAAATVDQDFKDELSAIEQWFKVLTEAERTAALYALLQQTTQVQIRFFIQVLKEMAKNHPTLGVLSPANFGEKDPMANRMSDASGKLSVAGARESMGRPPPASPGAKRNSGLPQETINAMFPAAASAIASQKAEYTQQTGNNPPASNRNSAAFGGGDRSSLLMPDQGKDGAAAQAPTSPWGQKSKAGDKSGPSPMGQFAQPPASGGMRASRPAALNANALHGADSGLPSGNDVPMMSPAGVGSWASMTNTPMVANFSQVANQNDMLANATAMKLAAMSTVNSRVKLDDPRKFRRDRSNEGGQMQMPMSPGMPGMGMPGMPNSGNVLVMNEAGQMVNTQMNQHLQALQLQQQVQMLQQARSRPTSPGMAMKSPGMPQASPMFASPQANGFLAAYDGGLATGMSNMSLGQYGLSSGGSLSGEDLERGRSPRGRRGSSKPPEDPTDLALLKDVPSWLRMLRLHKYTDALKDMKWQDLVQLDDDALEKKGVSALGARRKLLKAFETVREAQAAGKLS